MLDLMHHFLTLPIYCTVIALMERDERNFTLVDFREFMGTVDSKNAQRRTAC